MQLKETGPGQFRLTHTASGHDDMAVTLAMAVVTLLESNTTSGGREWLEQLGHEPEQEQNPSGWSLTSPFADTLQAPPGQAQFLDFLKQQDSQNNHWSNWAFRERRS